MWAYPTLGEDRFQNTVSLAVTADPETTHGEGATRATSASKPGLPIVGDGAGVKDDAATLEDVSAELDTASGGEVVTDGDGSMKEVSRAVDEDSTRDGPRVEEDGSMEDDTRADDKGSTDDDEIPNDDDSTRDEDIGVDDDTEEEEEARMDDDDAARLAEDDDRVERVVGELT